MTRFIPDHLLPSFEQISWPRNRSTLDVAGGLGRELVVEEGLPWWRFTSSEVLGPRLLGDALLNCQNLAESRLVETGSQWLTFKDADFSAAKDDPESQREEIFNLVTSLASLGLDLQIRAIHQGSKLNARYLLTVMQESNPGLPMPPFQRLPAEAWRQQMQIAIPLVEYKDEFLFTGEDLDKIYGSNNPLKQLKIYKQLQNPAYQLLAHIINGATPRTLYAAYACNLVPHSKMLLPKFEKLVGKNTAARMHDLVAGLFDRGLVVGLEFLDHLNVLPDYVEADRFIS